MSDNFNISTPDGNKVIASDDISSVWYQRVKLTHGKDGSADSDAGKYVSATDTTAFPVTNYPASDFMSAAGAAVTPVMTYTSLTSDGDIITAVTNKKILVLAIAIQQTTAADDLNWRDGAVGATILWSNLNLAQAVIHVLPYCQVGWFQSTSGNSIYGDITGSGPVLIQTVHVAV